MPWPHERQPLIDGDTLTAVTDALVALHLGYYHRVPRGARAEMLDEDLLCCSLSGVYTDVEKTLIEIEQGEIVSETRALFQHAIGARYKETVERLTGRIVDAFISKLYVGPDMAVELFVLRARDPMPA